MDAANLVEMLKEICSEEPILVVQAYRFFEDEMSLPEFKMTLRKAWQQGAVSLSRCDMPELFKGTDVEASALFHGIACFHMVQAKAWKQATSPMPRR